MFAAKRKSAGGLAIGTCVAPLVSTGAAGWRPAAARLRQRTGLATGRVSPQRRRQKHTGVSRDTNTGVRQRAKQARFPNPTCPVLTSYRSTVL